MNRPPQPASANHRKKTRVGRPSRSDRKPYNIEAITDVAVRVFNERGYDGASLDDVARAAGITKGSIYFHASGKEELLERALHRALDALFAVLREPGAREGRSLDRLQHVIRRMVEILVAKPAEVSLLLRVRGNTAIERWAIGRRRQFDRLVARILDQAEREGEVSAAVEPRLMIRLLFGMVNSITEWYRPGGKLTAREISDAILKLTLEGLR